MRVCFGYDNVVTQGIEGLIPVNQEHQGGFSSLVFGELIVFDIYFQRIVTDEILNSTTRSRVELLFRPLSFKTNTVDQFYLSLVSNEVDLISFTKRQFGFLIDNIEAISNKFESVSLNIELKAFSKCSSEIIMLSQIFKENDTNLIIEITERELGNLWNTVSSVNIERKLEISLDDVDISSISTIEMLAKSKLISQIKIDSMNTAFDSILNISKMCSIIDIDLVIERLNDRKLYEKIKKVNKLVKFQSYMFHKPEKITFNKGSL